MNAVRYAANRECPATTEKLPTPEAKTKMQAATQHNMIAKGTLAGEPISPISLTV
jgi:hypothetical protein